MNRFHNLHQLLASMLCALALMSPAYAYSPQEWRFNVLLDDKPIGQHVYRLSLEDGHQVLHSQADYEIRILGFTVYEYEHVATERWQGGCLTDIESRTTDNGKVISITGKTSDWGFLLNTADAKTTLAGCVMSFAYWNPDILTQAALLNAQNGEHLSIRVQNLGSSPLLLSDRQIIATRYRLITSKFSIDLWYGSNKEWLALETEVDGRRQLRYEIDPASHSLYRSHYHA